MTRSIGLLAAGLATSAIAQTPSFTSDTTISMPLSWSEVNGNNNGLLEPGESAEITLDVSFTNYYGLARFAPPIGTFTSGTLLGLSSGFIDLVGAGGAGGTFNNGLPPGGPLNNGDSGYGVRSGWRIVGGSSHGSVNASGTGVSEIQFGQFPGNPGPFPVTTIHRMFSLLWTPSDYRPCRHLRCVRSFPSNDCRGLPRARRHHRRLRLRSAREHHARIGQYPRGAGAGVDLRPRRGRDRAAPATAKPVM